VSASLGARTGAPPEAASHHDPALTGIRAVAALLVVATHAAFATGYLNHGYLGNVYARLEIGVALFFVLSGFLLFSPWVQAAADTTRRPSTRRYLRHRVRRIVPAYAVAVIVTFAVYTVFTPGPNPGQSWYGLLRYLTFTQIYTDSYLTTLLHPGLSQMWSMAVEVAFYAVLPLLAYLLLRGGWRPRRVLVGLALLAAVTPAWVLLVTTTDLLPNSAGMWLPAHLAWFAGGMTLAVLRCLGVRCRAAVAIPLAFALFLLVSTSLGGTLHGPDPVSAPVVKAVGYAVIATLAVAPLALGGRAPLALGNRAPTAPANRGGYARVLASRPVVWLGEISYEIFLLHSMLMAVALHLVLDWPLFTGSMPGLIATTLVLTVPAAWLLHRFTAPQRTRARNAGTSAASASPRWETASLSAGLSSAAVTAEPAGRNTGS